MFLDMLTADAASKHGHEFSEPTQANRWLGGRRSPFKVLPYTARPRLPTRSRSVRGIVGELGELPEEVDTTAVSRYYDMSVDDLHIPGSYRHDSPPVSPPRARSTTPRLFTDLTAGDIETQPSERAPSFTASSTSDKKSRRPKTQFSVAVPPPCALPLRKQGIARPRAFFQLQTRADSRFHRPIYELVPLSRIDGTRKVGQLIRRLGKVKENITNDDLAVVRVESYNINNTRRESIDVSETRDVLGIISPMPRSSGSQSTHAQIFLDGAMWDATTTNNGRYNLQCIGTDKHAARWYVPRTQKKRAQSPGGSGNADRKLYFAAILPHTTKHPTLASLSKTNLDIYDWYTLNTEANGPDALTPLETTTPLDLESGFSAWPAQHNETSSTSVFNVPIDDLHRKLIVVSSFWVMLCEGWSSQYTFPTAASSTSNSTLLPSGDRSMSLPVTKEDKLSISCATAPTSCLSTRATTPERLSAAASPAPSVHTENSQSKSNRLSFSSFNFKRLQSGSSVRYEDNVAPGRRDIASDVDIPRSQSHIEQPTIKDCHESSQVTKADTNGKLKDANDEVASTSRATRPGAFRFGSMVRRMSNSVSREGNDRRTRSISWKWQPTFRSDATNDARFSAEPVVAEKQVEVPSTHLARQEIEPVVAALVDDDDDEDDHIIIEAKPSPALLHKEPITRQLNASDSEAPAKETPKVLFSSNEAITPDAKYDVESEISKDVSSPPTEAKDSPLVIEKRWSISSSSSQEVDLATPYWKDFDRLQMHNFWRRAPSSSETAAAAGPDHPPHGMHDPNGNADKPKLRSTLVEDDVVHSIEPSHDSEHPQRPTSMIDSIRQSWRRRKPSLSPAEIPTIISR